MAQTGLSQRVWVTRLLSPLTRPEQPTARWASSRFSSPRASFDDTATYSAVATNAHGQVSTNAAVLVKRECACGGGGGGQAATPPAAASTARPSSCRLPRGRGAAAFRGTPHRT